MNFKNCIVWHAVKHISEMMFFFLFFYAWWHINNLTKTFLSYRETRFSLPTCLIIKKWFKNDHGHPTFFLPIIMRTCISGVFFKIKNQAWRRNLSRTTLLVRSYVKYIRSCASPRCLTHADLDGGCSGRFFKPPPSAIKIIPRPTHFHPTPSPKKNSKSAHITCSFFF